VAEISLKYDVTSGEFSFTADGKELPPVRAIDVSLRPQGFVEVTATFEISDFFLTGDGDLIVNAVPLSDDLGKEIYRSLHDWLCQRYGGEEFVKSLQIR
jgi:hypothetical protein